MRERMLVLGVGLLGSHAISWAFEYALYPFVLWRLGFWYGCLVMTSLSALACYVTLLFYDWSKKDWLGIEALKELKQLESEGRLARLLGRLLKKSDWLALLILTIYFDPFITVAYLRKGSYRFNGLSKREWHLFWFSVLAGNLFWSVLAFTGITLFRSLWKFLAT
jgi:hypothetical protein